MYMHNLKNALTKKGFTRPSAAIAAVINCTEMTAFNKLRGETQITVPEAVKIMKAYFRDDQHDMEQLFELT